MVVCVYVLRACVTEIILRIEDEGLIVSEQWDGGEVCSNSRIEIGAVGIKNFGIFG